MRDRAIPKIRMLLNIAVAVALAVVALVQLVSGLTSVLPQSPAGDFGLSLNDAWRVQQVEPGSPAARAHIRVGDFIDLSDQPVHDRYFFLGPAVPSPGDVTRIVVEQGGRRNTVTLHATRVKLSVADATSQIVQVVALFVFLGIAFILVLLRPGPMTWGLYLTSAICGWLLPGSPPNLPSKLVLPYTLFWDDVLVPAGTIGLLVFCLRFPANAPSGWRRKLERLLPFLLIFSVVAGTIQDFGRFFSAKPSGFAAWYQHVWDLTLVAVALVSFFSLAGAYRGSAGLERERIKWVVLGLAFACVTVVTAALDFDGRLTIVPQWIKTGLESLVVVFPVTLAYAIIRHRVIDVRFVLSRALIVGAILVAVGLGFTFVDWLFTTTLPNSRAQAAAYFGVALLIGFGLSAARGRVGRGIDALFFGEWLRCQQNADAISDTVSRARRVADFHEPLTTGLAKAFSLASVGLFERMPDGGLVRVAGYGWPSGTFWHALPGTELVQRLNRSARPLDLDSVAWHTTELPVGSARPSVMIPISANETAPAALLVGAHADGRGLDPDEMRAIRRVLAHAKPLYGRLMVLEPAVPLN